MALKSKSLATVRADLPVDQAAPREPVVRINLNVPASMRARWKTEAARLVNGKQRSLAELIVEAVEAHLSK